MTDPTTPTGDAALKQTLRDAADVIWALSQTVKMRSTGPLDNSDSASGEAMYRRLEKAIEALATPPQPDAALREALEAAINDIEWVNHHIPEVNRGIANVLPRAVGHIRAALAAAPAAVGAPDVEAISARVHEQWMETKRAQGVTSRKSEHGEELMVPYGQLSEAAKDLDRGTVRAVLKAMAALPAPPPAGPAVDVRAYSEKPATLFEAELIIADLRKQIAAALERGEAKSAGPAVTEVALRRLTEIADSLRASRRTRQTGFELAQIAAALERGEVRS